MTQKEILLDYLKRGFKITHRKGFNGFYIDNNWVAFAHTRSVIKQLRDAGIKVKFEKKGREKVWYLDPDTEHQLTKKRINGRTLWFAQKIKINKMNDNLKTIEIKLIQASTSNPRKQIDEQSIEELSKSIQLHGVLQPIIVREHPDYLEEEMYQVVCGERRYRASKMAGLKSIPAIIKDLTDDEAFELQIIENLERKDVHPLHEAEAFQKMLDSERYTLDDIAAKVAKTETFVAQRLKLNDLINPIKEDFFKGELGVGHAVLLARLSEEDQKKFYEDEIEGQWGDGYGTIAVLKNNISQEEYNLDNAIFDMNDANLISEAGACISCPKCSLANPVLFPDIQDNLCYDKSCFRAKAEQALLSKIKYILENGENIHFITCWDEKTSPAVDELLEGYKIKPLKYSDDFYESNDSKIQGLYINGHKYGQHVNIKLIKEQNTDTISNDTTNGDNLTQDLESQINKLEERADRSLELDREKVYKRILEEEGLLTGIIHQEEEDYRLRNELAPFVLALSESDWGFREWLEKEYEFEFSYNHIDNYSKLKEVLKKNDLGKIMRAFVVKKLPSNTLLDYGKFPTAAAVYDLVRAFAPLPIEIFETEQQEIANKRIERSEKRLDDLKKDLAQLQSETTTTE